MGHGEDVLNRAGLVTSSSGATPTLSPIAVFS
ncbi:hypothetical protein KT99_02867 [Shewanella benthica KT99]|uniref:Uncharacterized protein n=1 Tax=Shewanella benthica KT99 TaxID=314608 RepID=A9CY72_9GAMM|nr:hypothetical protein KT99_02867 [Shewanella benthica KT99]